MFLKSIMKAICYCQLSIDTIMNSVKRLFFFPLAYMPEQAVKKKEDSYSAYSDCLFPSLCSKCPLCIVGFHRLKPIFFSFHPYISYNRPPALDYIQISVTFDLIEVNNHLSRYFDLV